MDVTSKQPLMKIERPVYLQDDLNEATMYQPPSMPCNHLISHLNYSITKAFIVLSYSNGEERLSGVSV